MFASVNNTFMGSKMSSFHVSAEFGFERIKSMELHRSIYNSTTTGKLFIVDLINVLLTDSNIPSMLLYKKSQGHIPLL